MKTFRPTALVQAAIVMLAMPDLVHAAEPVRFVACPVYRDTDAGRKSGCWLATDPATGLRYDVSDAPFKPWIGHLVLVEGIPASTPDICGGVALAPVRTAVLPDTCAEALIPPEGYPSKPSVVPKTALQPLSVPRTPPAPPYTTQTYHIEFTFGDDRLMYQHVEQILEQAMLYAVAGHAGVRVTGYADSIGFEASSRHLAEPAELARARALVVKEALMRLGVPAERITADWNTQPASIAVPAGLPLVSKRRATITVTP